MSSTCLISCFHPLYGERVLISIGGTGHTKSITHCIDASNLRYGKMNKAWLANSIYMASVGYK